MRILCARDPKVVLTLSLSKGEGGFRDLINTQRQSGQKQKARSDPGLSL